MLCVIYIYREFLCVRTFGTTFIACLHVLLNESTDVMVEKKKKGGREYEHSTRKLKNDPRKQRERKKEEDMTEKRKGKERTNE